MTQAENLINLYETGFKICLALAVLFFALTIFMFFRFRILKVIANRTGRAQKKSIEQMQEANARTGHLRRAAQVAMGEYTPESLPQQPPEPEGTSVLAAEGTSVLASGEPKAPERRTASYTGRFTVTKEVLLIHADHFI